MISKYKQAENKKMKERAYKLHKTGMTTRDIGKAIGKSHTWVANAINDLSTEKIDKNLQTK